MTLCWLLEMILPMWRAGEAVGEYGVVLDQGIVGEATVGHEDGWEQVNAEGVEFANDWLELKEGPAKPLEFAKDGKDGGSRRELLGFEAFIGKDQTIEH